MSFDVFVSYSTKDAVAAKAACAALEAAKVRCWMAPRDVVPGARWGASIVRAINECRVMVLIFSGNANASEQVHREVDRAFSKGRAVVPLRIEDVTPADELAYYLDTVHWLDALTPPLERNLGKLVGTVQALLPTIEPAPPGDEALIDDRQAAQAQDEARAADERRFKEAEVAQVAEADRHERETEEASQRQGTEGQRYQKREGAGKSQEKVGARLSRRTTTMAFGVLGFAILAGGSVYLAERWTDDAARDRTNTAPVEAPRVNAPPAEAPKTSAPPVEHPRSSAPIVTDYVSGCFLVPIANPIHKDLMVIIFDKSSKKSTQRAIEKGKQEHYTVTSREFPETIDIGYIAPFFAQTIHFDGAGAVTFCTRIPQDTVMRLLKDL